MNNVLLIFFLVLLAAPAQANHTALPSSSAEEFTATRVAQTCNLVSGISPWSTVEFIYSIKIEEDGREVLVHTYSIMVAEWNVEYWRSRRILTPNDYDTSVIYFDPLLNDEEGEMKAWSRGSELDLEPDESLFELSGGNTDMTVTVVLDGVKRKSQWSCVDPNPHLEMAAVVANL